MRMPQKIKEYLDTQRVGVLAVQMLDGTPHGATVHFAHTTEPFEFTFETYRDYRKCEPLFVQDTTSATFVIGFTEGKQTLQMDGAAQLIDTTDERVELYLQKFPEKREKFADMGDKAVWFTFTPTWWRFTDWDTPDGKTIVSSEDV